MNDRALYREWNALCRAEQRFLASAAGQRPPRWQEAVAKYVPKSLDKTLNFAFFKAFQVIFQHGTPMIEKTYRRSRREEDYLVRDFSATTSSRRHALRGIHRQSNSDRRFHTALSAAGGVSMGLLGLGLPDIPVFLGTLLRSIYQTALSYGCSYDTEDEQIFILKLIEAALSREGIAERNAELNHWISAAASAQNSSQCIVRFSVTLDEQMKRTSAALSQELLYLKFVQGIPVIGVLGGLSDAVYMKKISQYAALKYRRRFLECKRH